MYLYQQGWYIMSCPDMAIIVKADQQHSTMTCFNQNGTHLACAWQQFQMWQCPTWLRAQKAWQSQAQSSITDWSMQWIASCLAQEAL